MTNDTNRSYHKNGKNPCITNAHPHTFHRKWIFHVPRRQRAREVRGNEKELVKFSSHTHHYDKIAIFFSIPLPSYFIGLNGAFRAAQQKKKVERFEKRFIIIYAYFNVFYHDFLFPPFFVCFAFFSFSLLSFSRCCAVMVTLCELLP